MEGREVVIVEAVRTPVGRGHPEKGYYKDVHPNALLGATFVEVIDRAGIPAAEVEDVITGCVQQYGEQSYNIGRNAWLQAGLPIEIPATTIDRQCGSAQQAVNFAAALVATGVHDVAIGGGVEHMGHIPLSVNGKLHQELGSPGLARPGGDRPSAHGRQRYPPGRPATSRSSPGSVRGGRRGRRSSRARSPAGSGPCARRRPGRPRVRARSS